jgi:hypothetical protein
MGRRIQRVIDSASSRFTRTAAAIGVAIIAGKSDHREQSFHLPEIGR